MSTRVMLEIRAWVCPFCKQSTEYVQVNDSCEIGCGMATLFGNGREADHCFACSHKAERFCDTGEPLFIEEDDKLSAGRTGAT